VSQAPARPRPRARNSAVNSDSRLHPLINAAAAYSVLAGLASFILGLLETDHLVGTILGTTGFLIGIWAQLVSATRAQRMVIVCGIVASFVGLGLGFAHGGFS